MCTIAFVPLPYKPLAHAFLTSAHNESKRPNNHVTNHTTDQLIDEREACRATEQSHQMCGGNDQRCFYLILCSLSRGVSRVAFFFSNWMDSYHVVPTTPAPIIVVWYSHPVSRHRQTVCPTVRLSVWQWSQTTIRPVFRVFYFVRKLSLFFYLFVFLSAITKKKSNDCLDAIAVLLCSCRCFCFRSVVWGLASPIHWVMAAIHSKFDFSLPLFLRNTHITIHNIIQRVALVRA